VIDLHCHLLPGIDDGPRTVDGALELARAQLGAHVHTVAATPHVTPTLPNEAAAIAADLQRLRTALADAGVGLDVVAGGEVDLAYAGQLADAELHALTLNGAGWLLLEAPLRADDGDVAAAVLAVARRGHRILLAHPERCPAFQRQPKALGELVAAGVRVQVTATALTGSFRSTVTRYAADVVEAGLCHVVASDAHDALRRPPGLVAEIAAVGHGDSAPLWTEENPAAILAGEDVPAAPSTPGSRRGRRRLWRR
jgi:protein-tyrosine phosphatase